MAISEIEPPAKLCYEQFLCCICCIEDMVYVRIYRNCTIILW